MIDNDKLYDDNRVINEIVRQAKLSYTWNWMGATKLFLIIYTI